MSRPGVARGSSGRSSRWRRPTGGSFRLLRRYMANSNLELTGLVVLGLVGGFAEAVSLVLVLQVALGLTEGADGVITIEVAGLSTDAALSTVLAVAAGVFVVQTIVSALAAWATAVISVAVMNGARRTTLRGFYGAEWSTVSGERAGELQEIMTTQVVRAAQAGQLFSQSMTSGLNFLALVVTAIAVSPATAVVIVVSFGGLFVVLGPLSVLAKSESRKAVDANIEYASAVAESVTLAEEYMTFAVGPAVDQELGRLVERVGRPWRNSRFYIRVLPGLYQGIAGLLIVVGLAVFSANSSGEVAAVGTVVVLLVRAVSYGQGAQSSYHNLVEMIPNVEAIDNQRKRYDEGRRVRGADQLGQIDQVSLEQICFAYVPGRDVLHDVSLSLVRGETLGIIGASGSGKSTLTQILLRMQRPYTGEYGVNGVDAFAFDDESWARRVAVVPQVPRLFVGSIRENIRFYRHPLSDDDVERAARMAQIHEEILAFENGYDTQTGPRADNVSGGQRQRICIARALAGTPDMLLLDEPTSALDLGSEARFRDALRSIKGTLTLVIVTHRLSTLELCDRVLVLRAGHVEALEPLDDLQRKSEFFTDTLRNAGIAR